MDKKTKTKVRARLCKQNNKTEEKIDKTNDDESMEKNQKKINKKEKYDSFYTSQKTIVGESFSEHTSMEAAERMNSPEKEISSHTIQNVPTIIEDLVSKQSNEECITEKSELLVNDKDYNGIVEECQSPEIEKDFKVYASDVRLFHNLKPNSNDHLSTYNTSDEEFSSLEYEPKNNPLKKSKFRIKLTGLDDSDSEDPITECICLHDDNEVDKLLDAKKKKRKKSIVTDISTDESDLDVSAIDYYKIRHETATSNKVEYSLSWSPTRFDTHMGGFKGSNKFKKKLSSKIQENIKQPVVELPGSGESITDSEEIDCEEKDFMSFEEFLLAHQTNYKLDQTELKNKIKLTSKPSVCYSEKEYVEDNQSTDSDLSQHSQDLAGGEEESTATDVFESEWSDAECSPKLTRGVIRLVESQGSDGTVAILCTSPQSKTNDHVTGIRFRPVEVSLEIENVEAEAEAISESIEDQDNKDVRNEDDTDEENVSSIDEEKSKHVDVWPEYHLPKLHKRIHRILERNDGSIEITENLIEQQESIGKQAESSGESEDESLEELQDENEAFSVNGLSLEAEPVMMTIDQSSTMSKIISQHKYKYRKGKSFPEFNRANSVEENVEA